MQQNTFLRNNKTNNCVTNYKKKFYFFLNAGTIAKGVAMDGGARVKRGGHLERKFEWGAKFVTIYL